MSKESKGSKWGDPHPTRPWFPNMPGHQQKLKRMSDEIKEWLVQQTKRIFEDLKENQRSVFERKE